MELAIYQVDAFASKCFRGNPAAVIPLDEWLPDATLQAMAMENNLSETAYFVRTGERHHLRWFTPVAEVDLCGHATLASAWVLFHQLGYAREQVVFDTLSGPLTVRREGDLLVMDFPATPARPVPAPMTLVNAMGAKPIEVLESRDFLFVYPDAATVAALEPNMEQLKRLVPFGLIATAPGDDCDFVSRFFAPAKGVPEDPVTGSAHCTLTPYWAEKLGKTQFRARQISARGGDLECELLGDRVLLKGQGVLFLRGTVLLEEKG